MKKIFAAFVATLMMITVAAMPVFAAEDTTVPETTIAEPTTAPAYEYSIIDATNIQKEIVGLIDPFTPEEVALYDVDHDGVISVIDSTTIQKMIVGLV